MGKELIDFKYNLSFFNIVNINVSVIHLSAKIFIIIKGYSDVFVKIY